MSKQSNSMSSRNTAVIKFMVILISVILAFIAGIVLHGLFQYRGQENPQPIYVMTQSTPSVPENTHNIEYAEIILAGMSLSEKVYQLFITYPTEVNAKVRLNENTQSLMNQKAVGGFVFSAASLESSVQTKQLCDDLQALSKIPLIIAADEEGGRVERLMSKLGTTRIGAMFEYKDGGTDVAYDNARTIAADLKANGLNTDFAPVADVWSNPENTVIGDRAYSDDYSQAAELVAAAVRGFKDSGVLCALKHFPGHGDTYTDSHYEQAFVPKSVAELKSGELLPFVAGIEAGADMVMIGHLTVTEYTDEPATVSWEVVTKLLRDELGFDGVIITDSLGMAAVSKYGDAELSVRAIKAGIDILLGPTDLDRAAGGIFNAINSGELTEERINESVLRILRMKLKQGIISEPNTLNY